MPRYLTQSESSQIDIHLLSDEFGFSIDQLMELAGLSCAQSIYHFYPDKRVLVLAGPGNNGGDGLVCARHLKHFGCEVEVIYPKTPTKDLYKRLLNQLKQIDISVMHQLTDISKYEVIVDAIFGFSFKCMSIEDIKSPFREMIHSIVSVKTQNPSIKLVSIDIPSGWDVEKGDIHQTNLMPDLLISLTAPKLCSQNFKGKHVVGGRFVPFNMAKELGIEVDYKGSEQFAILRSRNNDAKGGGKL